VRIAFLLESWEIACPSLPAVDEDLALTTDPPGLGSFLGRKIQSIGSGGYPKK
jgi:hypothetical protein